MPLDITKIETLLYRFQEAFEGTDSSAIVETLIVFLYAVQNPGLTSAEIGDHFRGIPKTTLARHLGAIWDGYRTNGRFYPGAKLIEDESDPNDNRRKPLVLTPKGKRIAALLAD